MYAVRVAVWLSSEAAAWAKKKFISESYETDLLLLIGAQQLSACENVGKSLWGN